MGAGRRNEVTGSRWKGEATGNGPSTEFRTPGGSLGGAPELSQKREGLARLE